LTSAVLGHLRRIDDALPRTVHAGVLVPWANVIVEAELPRLALGRVVFHYARLVPSNAATRLDEDFLRGILSAVPGAMRQLARLPLMGVSIACTSAGFAIPPSETDSETSHLRVITAFDSLVTTLREFAARRIVLLTPYPPTITCQEVEALGQEGFEVTAHASLGRDDGYARIGRADVLRLAVGVGQRYFEAADAVVLSCTGWPTLDLVPELESKVGRPVVSSNLAVAVGIAAQAATIT
jgi:maleate isomerase